MLELPRGGPRARHDAVLAALAALGAYACGGTKAGGRRWGTLHAVLLMAITLEVFFFAARARACDMCATYTATELQETRTGPRLGISEQYTHFGNLQNNGASTRDVLGQYLDSSITQLVAGYVPLPRLGVQVNVPIIDRSYRRSGGTGVQTGDVSGLGDISLTVSGLAYSEMTETHLFRLTGLFGLKFPSGSSSELRGELNPTPTPDPCEGIPPVFCSARQASLRSARLQPRHSTTTNGIPSAVHGHDLALGSGSTDVLLGAQGLWTWHRFYGTAGFQYAVRTTGAYGYTYANDLNVGGTAGRFIFLEDNYTLGLEAVITCETKGNDSLNGQPETDTGLTVLYAGPGLRFTWGSALSAELIGDIPGIENNAGFQVVPSYRIRGGMLWRF